MVDDERDSEQVDANKEETGAGEADPTLDIVRQLIVEAEALPAPAPRPRGPATPRPGTEGAAANTTVAVTPTAQPVVAPQPDALSEAWDDEPEDEDWSDLASGGTARPYGIVDPETGEVVALEGGDPDGWDEDGNEIGEASAARKPRKSVLGRWLGWMLRALAGLVVAIVRAVARWIGAGLAAAGRVVARFMRRPDAARRIAVALLVIFVIAWPFKVLWLTLLIPLAAFITWASVGNEGCVELIVAWHARMKARDAEKAERIRLRAAATSRAIGRLLDRLPDRWTQGLYLPDFEPEGYVPEKLQVDPFEELAARVHSAKRANGH